MYSFHIYICPKSSTAKIDKLPKKSDKLLLWMNGLPPLRNLQFLLYQCRKLRITKLLNELPKHLITKCYLT